MKNPKSILITGATSGLGRALALHYAKPGVHLSVNGRDEEPLRAIELELMQKGAAVDARALDVNDREGMSDWIQEIDALFPLDLVIANAGIGTPRDDGLTYDEKTRRVFDTNVYGVFNTIHPALDGMQKRGHGQIAIMSSMAGYIGLGNAPGYSASKAAVKAYGRALRTKFLNGGIVVTVLTPGIVPTRMTEKYKGKFPGSVPMDTAIRIIARGIEQDRGLVAFPRRWSLLAVWMSTLPESWVDHIHGKIFGWAKKAG
ncbi:MAG TPA: SDR family NAD(P)-dependent oxidoreductase [bacterium]|jgi:short-subunit dehydrogenase